MNETEKVVEPASTWSALLGPVVDGKTAKQLLKVTNQALEALVLDKKVLAVKTKDAHTAYPLSQFKVTGGEIQVVAGLEIVLGALGDGVDGLAKARWLATPNRRLGGRQPMDVLTTNQRVENVVKAARTQADVWAGRYHNLTATQA